MLEAVHEGLPAPRCSERILSVSTRAFRSSHLHPLVWQLCRILKPSASRDVWVPVSGSTGELMLCELQPRWCPVRANCERPVINLPFQGFWGQRRGEGWFLIFEVLLNHDADILFRELAACSLYVGSVLHSESSLRQASQLVAEHLRTAEPCRRLPRGAGLGPT